jgi:hypothetical protein
MAEYIERETLIAEYDRVHIGEAGGARKLMVEAPAADVVEVVRCKDCKHRKTAECSMYVECDCGSQHTWECDNDFCSYGERRCEE